MAIIVEDGTGKTDAESYISVSDADDYASNWYGTLSDWDDLADAAKERALRIGTRFIDSHEFKGYRANDDQVLSWPRAQLGYIDGQYIDADEIPQRVERATVEAALKYIQGETLFPDHYGASVKSESKTIGPIGNSTTYQTSKKAQKVFEAVKRLLDPLLMQSGTIARGMG